MKIKDLCKDDRPREKLLARGAEALSNAELLAILLRSGTGGLNVIDMARELLSRAGGTLTGLSGLSIDRLTEVPGIGTDKAAGLLAAFEWGRRFATENAGIEKSSISDPAMIYRLMAPRLKGLDHEECWVIYLNRANYILSKEMMSSGGMSSTVIDNKVIVRRVLERKASGLIMVHNHPSGNPRPGKMDLVQTRLLKEALAPFDVSLIDHIIIADDKFYSFANEEVGGP